MNNEPLFVFDVESIGLYGEGFAAAFTVVLEGGNELESGFFACHPDNAAGTDADREWVMTHVFPQLGPLHYAQPSDVRYALWQAMEFWKEHGALIFADCAAPVEAKFLAARMTDYLPPDPFDGPYPLHDAATVLLCAGLDPLATYDRLPGELPAHNPLNDARQSARMLLQALALIEQRRVTVKNLTPQAMRDLRNSMEHFLARQGWRKSSVTAVYDKAPSVYWNWTHPDHENAHRADNGWSMDAALAFEARRHAG